MSPAPGVLECADMSALSNATGSAARKKRRPRDCGAALQNGTLRFLSCLLCAIYAERNRSHRPQRCSHAPGGRHDRALQRCTGNGAQRRRYSSIYEIDHIKSAKALVRQAKKAE
jgi:hypothetical protein